MIDEELPVSSGKEWRANREQGVIIQLPYSGRIVRLRTVRPDMLLRLGKIPDVLSALVVEMIYGKVTPDSYEDFLLPSERLGEAAEMLESLSVVCKAGMVSPRVVDNPQADDEICIDDIELPDRGFIFRLVFVSAEALTNFRYESPADVEVVANGAAEPQPAL